MGLMVEEDAAVTLTVIETLPQSSASNDADTEMRAVLRNLLVRVAAAPREAAPVAADPRTCPNCGASCESLKAPYCSTMCKGTAAFVRQVRKAIRVQTILEPERQVGIGEALWSLQGGGFPRRQRLVPKRVLAKVIERDGGVCSVCGGPATEVDHEGSG